MLFNRRAKCYGLASWIIAQTLSYLVSYGIYDWSKSENMISTTWVNWSIDECGDSHENTKFHKEVLISSFALCSLGFFYPAIWFDQAFLGGTRDEWVGKWWMRPIITMILCVPSLLIYSIVSSTHNIVFVIAFKYTLPIVFLQILLFAFGKYFYYLLGSNTPIDGKLPCRRRWYRIAMNRSIAYSIDESTS